MSEVDFVILAIFAISALVSFKRGFLREAMSLAAWVGAVVITVLYTHRFATLLPIDRVDSAQVRATISALILFFGTLFIGKLINWLLARLMARKQLRTPDKAIGIGFGILRGIVVVTLLVLGANLVPDLRLENWWIESTFLPYFQQSAQFVHEKLPEGISQHFNFQPRY